MANTRAKPQRRVVSSDLDDTVAPSTQNKTRERERTRSSKQQNDDIHKRDTEIEKLKMQLGKEKRKSSTNKRKRAEQENNDDDVRFDENGVPYESEEDDDSTIHYQAPMKKLAPAPETPRKKILRREKVAVPGKGHDQDSDSPLRFPSSPSSLSAAVHEEHEDDGEHEHQHSRHRDDDLHPYLIPNNGPSRKRRHTDHISTSSPPPEQSDSGGILKAEFKDRQVPAHDVRAAASQYAAPVKRRILCAIRDFEVQIYTFNPFPCSEEQVAQAVESWKRVNDELEQEMELTDRILTLISSRGSRARGALVSAIRPRIAAHYGFSQSSSRKVIHANSEKANSLLEDGAFHYKDVENLTGFLQNDIITAGIRELFFKRRSSIGVTFGDLFHPISLVTLALLISAVDFCIREWSTGQFQQVRFWETDNKTRYDSYLTKLNEWSDVDPGVTRNMRKKMSKRARQSIGVGLEAEGITSHLSKGAKARVQDELAGRTGETDSEMSGAEST